MGVKFSLTLTNEIENSTLLYQQCNLIWGSRINQNNQNIPSNSTITIQFHGNAPTSGVEGTLLYLIKDDSYQHETKIYFKIYFNVAYDVNLYPLSFNVFLQDEVGNVHDEYKVSRTDFKPKNFGSGIVEIGYRIYNNLEKRLSRSMKKSEEGMNNLCVICLERPREIMFVDCKHLVLCNAEECDVNECPMCRGEGEKVKVFIN